MAWQSSTVGNLRLSLSHFTHFPQKVDGSLLKLAGFLASYRHLMSTLHMHIFSHIYACIHAMVTTLNCGLIK